MPVNAYAAMNKGEDLQNFNYEPKTLDPHEVEVKITHCGICYSDVHLTYIPAPNVIREFPLIF